MHIFIDLLLDPRLSVVLAPLALATYSTLFFLEYFDRQFDQ